MAHPLLCAAGTVYTVITILLGFVIGWMLQVLTLVVIYPFTSKAQRVNILGHIFRGMNAFIILINPMWHITRIGDLPANPGKAIIMSNHLSNADPFFCCTGLFPWETKYIAKSSLFSVPFGGWSMSLSGDIPVYFTKAKGGWGLKKGSVAEMMKYCTWLLDNELPIFVYPEGSRSRTGELQPFKDGFFRLAVETNTPIIPTAISGPERGWPVKDWKLRPCHAKMMVGEPISPNGRDALELKAAVRASIEDMLTKLPPIQKRLVEKKVD